ncbi:MAG: alpha/beta fold hydrolase [Rhodospirillaceae bacterium]|jgi:dienelactone hydrolase|nr:alpha/beta fold hydrolase [Rhodospirillaceae bacterium]
MNSMTLISLVVSAVVSSPTAIAAEAYKPDNGPFGIIVSDNVAINADNGERSIRLRISYPDGNGPFPLVVLSHGGGCVGGSYGAVGDHWTSHGYVVIQPTHPDSASLGFDMANVDPREMEGIIRTRIADLSITIDKIPYIERALPSLSGKIDPERLVASGHSMGGATALASTGMVLENPYSKETIDSGEDRFDALLLLSEPGHNPTLPEFPWQTIDVPTLVYTGTNDRGSESGESTRIPFQYNIVNEMPDPVPPKHHLWIDDVDHFLGGAWCRTTEPFDQEGLDALRGVSTAFLDAYAKDDDVAREFLEAGVLPERAGSRPILSQR